MRFKIYFNEQLQNLDINCLADTFSDTILPEDVNQHVYFPIPNDLQKEIKDNLMPLLDDGSASELRDILEQIKNLTDRRRDVINELRVKLNPQIIEKCQQFKEDNAEYFI